jgi:hypothetical protein
MKLLEAPLTLHNSSVPGLTASLVPSIAIGKSGVFSQWEVHTSVVHWLLDCNFFVRPRGLGCCPNGEFTVRRDHNHGEGHG